MVEVFNMWEIIFSLYINKKQREIKNVEGLVIDKQK